MTLTMAVSVLRVQPGDVLAITVPASTIFTQEYCDQMRAALTRAMPDQKFVFFQNIESITVVRNGETIKPEAIEAEPSVIIEVKS